MPQFRFYPVIQPKLATSAIPRPTLAWRRTAPSVLIVTVYLLIGAVAFWPLNFHYLFGYQTDYIASVWCLAWLPHALAHGLNPFFSNAIFAPVGVNLAQNTSTPLLGLLTTPLAAFDPIVRANVLMGLAMPLSATAAFAVLRKWQVWTPAAAIGGLMYGFSPYMVGHATAHVNLIFIPLPPLIALTVASIAQRRGSPRRLGIQLGLLVTAQFLISSPEVLTIVAICGVVAIVWVVLRNPQTARVLAQPLAIGAGMAGVLLAYPIWMMVAGPQHFTGEPWMTTNPFHNDLLSFVAPGPLQRVSLGMRGLGTRLASASQAAAPTEVTGYIGIPILLLAGILAWRSRRSSRMQLAVVLLLSAGILSLGPHLEVNGHLTQVPLPFLAIDHLPLLGDILPGRFNFAVAAFLGTVIAFGLDDIHREHVRSRAVIIAAGALVVMVVTQLPKWPPQGAYAPHPLPVLPANVRLPEGDPVAITYPYATYLNPDPMLWQAEDGFKFRLLGGYAYHPTSTGAPTAVPTPMTPSGLQAFLASHEGAGGYSPPLSLGPKLVAITRTTLSRYDVRLVIVERLMPGSGPVMKLFTDALGPPGQSRGGFSIWTSYSRAPLPGQSPQRF